MSVFINDEVYICSIASVGDMHCIQLFLNIPVLVSSRWVPSVQSPHGLESWWIWGSTGRTGDVKYVELHHLLAAPTVIDAESGAKIKRE